MRIKEVGETALFAFAIALVFSCDRHNADAKRRVIEAALKPLEQVEIPTGSRLNIGRNSVPLFRRFEAAGLIRIEDVPQGYWDNFASQTFMEGAKPLRVVATQKLNEVALNPRWKLSSQAAVLSEKTIARTLEDSWNFYAQREMFLGPICFGRDVSGQSDGFCGHELNDDYPTYLALAMNGLIKLDEISPGNVLPSTDVNLPRVAVERVANLSLTAQGRRLASVDEKNSKATFVFGTYNVEQVTKNTPISSNHGDYRLVEGTYVFNLRPEFKKVWEQAGKPTIRERRFRAVFYYNEKYPLSEISAPTQQQLEFLARCTKCTPRWTVATASNGRYTAEDDGPRNGEFESANVPPTVDEIPLRGTTGDDSYTWHLRVGELKVGEILRDEEYKGPLATPGETFRLVLAKIEHAPVERTSAIPADVGDLLPGRLRCVLKYSDFDKAWKVVALDVSPADSEQWGSANVR